jgi:pre-mRNA-splicing factor SYF1
MWKKYLDLRRAQIKGLNPIQHADQFDAVNECYERALVLLNKVTGVLLRCSTQ